MEWLSNPAVLLLLGAIPGFTLGILGYWRSRQVDKATEKTEFILAQSTAVQQVISGLNQLIDALQQDNKELRENIKIIAIKLSEVVNERDLLVKETGKLKDKYNGK